MDVIIDLYGLFRLVGVGFPTKVMRSGARLPQKVQA